MMPLSRSYTQNIHKILLKSMIHFISNVIIQFFETIKKYASFYSLQETTEKILHIFVKIAVFLCLAHVS